MSNTRQYDPLEDLSAMMHPKETALMLGLSTRTLEKWRLDNRGPRYIRIGTRIVRYRRGDILEFIEAGENGGVQS